MRLVQHALLGWLSFTSAKILGIGEICLEDGDNECLSQHCVPECGSSVWRCIEPKLFFFHHHVHFESCIPRMTAKFLEKSIRKKTTLSNYGQVCNNHDDCVTKNCALFRSEPGGRCIEPVFSFKRFKIPIPEYIEQSTLSYLKSTRDNVHDYIRLTTKIDNDVAPNNPHPYWCPNTSCIKGICGNTCNRRFLFVLAQGRTGSTTIKNMLNLLPGVRIRGELGNRDSVDEMINHFNSIHTGYNEMKKAFGHEEITHASLQCLAQNTIEIIDPPPPGNIKDDSLTIIGFKEIRFNTTEKINFLLNFFPCSRFIFSTRNDKDVVKSQNKNFINGDEYNEKEVRFIRTLFRKFKKRLGQKVYWMNLEEWSTGNGEHFTSLSKWLGFRECNYKGLLHDNFNGYHADEKIVQVGSTCRYGN